jgi:transcriptional regulator with XRE-family HTH domain
MPMNTLDKILYLIKKNGLTELEFTQKAGLNKTAVTEWKKRKTKSYYKHIPNIADVLKISASELLEDKNIGNNNISQNPNTSIDNPLEPDRELILVTEEEKYLIELIRKLTPRQRIKIEGLVEDKVKEYTQGLYPNQTSSDCQIGPNEITATKLA